MVTLEDFWACSRPVLRWRSRGQAPAPHAGTRCRRFGQTEGTAGPWQLCLSAGGVWRCENRRISDFLAQRDFRTRVTLDLLLLRQSGNRQGSGAQPFAWGAAPLGHPHPASLPLQVLWRGPCTGESPGGWGTGTNSQTPGPSPQGQAGRRSRAGAREQACSLPHVSPISDHPTGKLPVHVSGYRHP